MPTTGLTTRPQAATQTPTTPSANTPAASTAAPASPARIVNPAPPVVRLGAAAESKPKGAGAGAPLAPSVQATLEKRLGVDLSAVRVHTEQVSSTAVGAVSARAFTRGTDIFLGKGERPTDLALIAHEVAHVVQQKGAPKTAAKAQRFTNVGGDALETEAQRASSAVVRGEQFTVRERTTGARMQRWGVDDALNKFADLANMIPGYRMFTIVLGVNPINMSPVDRSAANILRAIVEFIPGGGLITRALDTYGVFEKVGGWIEGQIKSLGMTGSAIRQALMDFIHSLKWTDVFDLGGVWDRAKAIFTAPVARLISFAKGLLQGILDFIKEAVLKPLAQLAKNSPGYDLLKAVLGKDPITGEAAEQSADALIGGFMKLIGQEEVWANIKKGNAIARAFAWFKGALSGLLGFVRQIPGMIMGLLRSITIEDFLPITNLFGKVVKTFGGFLGSFGSWALAQVIELLKIIFDVVAPSVVPYIMKAAGAFKTIVKNPIGFVGNLVRAGLLGFKQFAGNFLNHLRKSLIEWLTGTLSGAAIYIPQSFSLKEMIKFVLSVLGLTWANVRPKLVKAMTEPVVVALEATFDIVVTLVKDGPAAAWEKLKDYLSNLRDMVLEQVISFVKERVIDAAIQKLLTSLNPAGAFIQAIIAIYNTIMFFVERLQQIARVVAAFIDSISAIASGNIGSAASRVETTMAGMLTLVISFLARIAGLGKVTDAVLKIVKKVRDPIDKAIDAVIAWIVATAKRLFATLFGKKKDDKGKGVGEIGESVSFSAGEEGHRLWINVSGESADVMLASAQKPLSAYLKEFGKDAKDIEDAASKSKVLSAVGQATPLAKSIEKSAKKAAKKSTDQAVRETLNDQIKKDEKSLSPILTIILTELGVRVPPEIKPPIAVQFTADPRFGKFVGEYNRQLKMQEAAINGMTVENWIANRDRYVQRREATGSGRDPRSQKAQDDLRALTTQNLIFRLVNGINAKSPAMPSQEEGFLASVFGSYTPETQRKGLATSTATSRVTAWMKTQHALHSPDQVAGGNFDDLTGMGDAVVNVDIGANWGKYKKPKHLAKDLERDVKASMARLKVRRAFWRQVKMKVTLNV
jgi:hypothetical protein